MVRRLVALIAGCFVWASIAEAAPSTDARSLVAVALSAQGGEAKLRAVKSVRLHAMARTNALEQSIRPEGPWFENYSDVIELRRFETPALRREARSRGYTSDWWTQARWAETTSLVTGGAAFRVVDGALARASQADTDAAEEGLALGPERALITALEAGDLHLEKPSDLHGRNHDVVGFTWRSAPVRIYLTPVSHMPAAVEIVRPRPLNMFWSSWGDIVTRVEWEGWTLEPGGVRYPRFWRTSSNGQVEQARMIDQVEFNPAIDPATLAADASDIDKARAARKPISAIAFPTDRTVAVAPGITLFKGAWNVVQVDGDDGVYVIESPISNTYSQGVMAQARSGGRTLRGMITTSDSWPHIGGIRQYAADGVPVVALDLNRPLIERILAAPHRQEPDDLARNPRPIKLRTVAEPVTIGRGKNAMRLIPIRTVSGERQMAVYWPAHRLLYTSDILNPRSDGTIWLPQYRDEIADMIAREQLDVQTLFGMHYDPVPWASVRNMAGPESQ